MSQKNQPNIVRGKHNKEHPYVMISKSMLKDKSISPQSKGVLCYLLSLPDDWKTNPRQVAEAMGVGEERIYTALRELIKENYCLYSRNRNESGQWGPSRYEFFEERLPRRGFPDGDCPDGENRHYTKDIELQEIKKESNESGPFIDFLPIEDEEEKLQILSKYPLDHAAIAKILAYSLEHIKTSLKAYDQWVQNRLDENNPPTSIVAPVMKAILHGWKPSLTPNEIKSEQDEQVKKYQDLLALRRDHVKQIEKTCEGKLPFRYSIKAGENEVTLRFDNSYSPIGYDDDQVIKMVQNHVDKYWIKENV